MIGGLTDGGEAGHGFYRLEARPGGKVEVRRL